MTIDDRVEVAVNYDTSYVRIEELEISRLDEQRKAVPIDASVQEITMFGDISVIDALISSFFFYKD